MPPSPFSPYRPSSFTPTPASPLTAAAGASATAASSSIPASPCGPLRSLASTSIRYVLPPSPTVFSVLIPAIQPGGGPRGRGRGRGGAPPFGNPSGDSGWSKGRGGSTSAASGSGFSKPLPAGPRSATTKDKEKEQEPTWGKGWGSSDASGGWGAASVPQEARSTGPTNSADTGGGWGAPDTGWSGASSGSGWGNTGGGESASGGWGDTGGGGWGSSSDGWGSGGGWGTAATETTKEKEKDKALETPKDPFGFTAVSTSGKWGNASEPSTSTSAKDAPAQQPQPYAPEQTGGPTPETTTLPHPPSPVRSEHSDRPAPSRRGSAREELSITIPSTYDVLSSAASASASPFASLLNPSTAERKTSYTFSDFGAGIPRAASPSPSNTEEPQSASSSMARDPWQKYIKCLLTLPGDRAIQRAVTLHQKLAEAEAKRDSLRRLQKSPQFHSATPRMIERLEGLRIEHERVLGGLKKRFSDAINTLAAFPPGISPFDGPSRAGSVGADAEPPPAAEDIERYAVEVREWMDAVRPYVDSLRAQATQPPPAPPAEEDAPQVPAKRKRRAGDTDAQDPVESAVAEVSERLARLEVTADELDTYLQDLRTSSQAAINAALVRIEQAAVPPEPTEDGEIVPVPALDADVGVPGACTRRLREASSELARLRGELKTLQTRDHNWWRQQYALNAENEGLKMRISQLEESETQERAQLAADAQELRKLREQVQNLTAPRPDVPQLPPQPSLDDLVSLFEAEMRPRWREDAMRGLGAMREGVEQQLRTQQQAVLSQVWGAMKPTLRIVDSIQDFMEVQSTSSDQQAVSS
ncbi:hypothetical protein IEO21_02612 [Rhodonia placenta]|uniref:Uncharacterized protein n=1 Tax=Rhodonia placenta TaxID=104341 RepID=A0A8H7P7G4_9APHY|nr:hypothetical protein IEO21_02612 [Postia placenta]